MPSKEMQRLSTYAQWPMPSDACSGISNFVFKAAGAHFERTADCVNDEVICQSCGLRFSGWSTDVPPFKCNLRESPAAVHRIISPRCPALNPSDSDEGITTRVASFTELQAYISSLMESMFASSSSSDIQTAGSMTPEQSLRPTNVQRATRVQRVLFPESQEHNQQDADEDHQNTVSEVCQSDSMSNPVPHSSVLDQTPITHPFKPKSGNYEHLFASHRLQTFPQPIRNTRFQTWAEEGFIYRREQQDVMCVYCGTALILNGHQPGAVHGNASPSCPFAMGFDVGNISQNLEKCVRLVYFKQQAAKKFSDSEIRIKCVQFQKEEDRMGSFQGWPKMCAKIFPASAMASAGFFYSGCSDKVKCYSCGVELFDWSEDADVWKTHATVSPTCLHVINSKGQDFIAQAASLQVLAEVKYPEEQNAGDITSSDGVWGEEPGSPILDMTAVKAALACGYTLQQIQHAIFKFFCQTSRYPNEAILKASLKAADENHITICQQQQVNLEKDTQLQQKDTQLQQKDTHLQRLNESHQQQLNEKEEQLNEKEEQLNEKEEQLSESYQQLSEKEEQLREKEEQLRWQDQQIQSLMSYQQLREKEEQLRWQNQQIQSLMSYQQLREKEEQLRWQDQQIQSLMQQVQRLRADRQHRADLAPGPQGDGANNARNEENNHQPLVCKICMSDRPRMIFLPCGHIFSCAECTSRLPGQCCPVCRQDISQVLPAFVA